jgi:hypothetical protein
MSGLGRKRQSRIVVDESVSPAIADLSEPPRDFALEGYKEKCR